MKTLIKVTVWFYSFFSDSTIEAAARGLYHLLYRRRIESNNKTRKQFPEYRKYKVDPTPPIIEPQSEPVLMDYKAILELKKAQTGKELKPVKTRKNSTSVPDSVSCTACGAPHIYIYYNDGKRKTQLRCKVCQHLFQIQPSLKPSIQTRYFCPHCNHALYRWKVLERFTIHKCGNDNCPHRLKAIAKLNVKEKTKMKSHSSQFKLCYQFREYQLAPDELHITSPDKPRVSIDKIHHSLNVLCLVLTFHVSYALSARKTSLLLKDVFQINASYQTILNYSQAAAYYCHRFNLSFKGEVDTTSVGDETYIKINGKNHFTWLFVSPKRRSISSYHLSDNRGALPAIVSMSEAKRTIPADKPVTFITDGNPSYISACVYFNSQTTQDPLIEHHKVIGLQNLDSESELYRPFKQIMERTNRTYKYHVHSAYGFDSFNGAVSLTTLFVTHYNFLRPHSFLNYETPIIIPELSKIPTIQGKWAKILKMSFTLSPPFS